MTTSLPAAVPASMSALGLLDLVEVVAAVDGHCGPPFGHGVEELLDHSCWQVGGVAPIGGQPEPSGDVFDGVEVRC